MKKDNFALLLITGYMVLSPYMSYDSWDLVIFFHLRLLLPPFHLADLLTMRALACDALCALGLLVEALGALVAAKCSLAGFTISERKKFRHPPKNPKFRVVFNIFYYF